MRLNIHPHRDLAYLRTLILQLRRAIGQETLSQVILGINGDLCTLPLSCFCRFSQIRSKHQGVSYSLYCTAESCTTCTFDASRSPAADSDWEATLDFGIAKEAPSSSYTLGIFSGRSHPPRTSAQRSRVPGPHPNVGSSAKRSLIATSSIELSASSAAVDGRSLPLAEADMSMKYGSGMIPCLPWLLAAGPGDQFNAVAKGRSLVHRPSKALRATTLVVTPSPSWPSNESQIAAHLDMAFPRLVPILDSLAALAPINWDLGPGTSNLRLIPNGGLTWQ
ncbi:unnamed protein product [Diplocarpon coronariae]